MFRSYSAQTLNVEAALSSRPCEIFVRQKNFGSRF